MSISQALAAKKAMNQIKSGEPSMFQSLLGQEDDSRIQDDGSYSSLWEPNGFYLFLGYLAQILLTGIPALLLLLTLLTHWDSWGRYIFVTGSSSECDQPLLFFLFLTLLTLSLQFLIATGLSEIACGHRVDADWFLCSLLLDGQPVLRST